MLARSLIALDVLALVVSLVCLISFGADAPFVARVYILEGFFNLIGFSIIVLGLEQILILVLGHSVYAYDKFLNERRIAGAFVAQHCGLRTVTKNGDTILQLPSALYASIMCSVLTKADETPAIPNELVSSASSTTQTSMDEINKDSTQTSMDVINKDSAPTSMDEINKDSAMSDDGCSAATTACTNQG